MGSAGCALAWDVPAVGDIRCHLRPLFLLNPPLWGTKKKLLFCNPPGEIPGCWAPWGHGDTAACLGVPPQAPGRLHRAPLNGLIISNYLHSCGLWGALGVFPEESPWSSQGTCPQNGGSQAAKTLKDMSPKQGGPKGPGPSRTGPQSLCPQSGGPTGPRARSLKSLSPERPPPQLACLNPWSPKPPQSRGPIFHIPQAQELQRHRAAQDTPRPCWERGQKGAVTGRATPGDTVCATNLRGGFPPSLWCPRGPRAGGTWIWGSGHILAG